MAGSPVVKPSSSDSGNRRDSDNGTDISKAEILRELKGLLSKIKSTYDVEEQDILEIMQEEYIPASVFSTEKLTIFESAVKYLHENKRKKFSQISRQLQRSQKTIWTTYTRAKRKNPKKIFPQLNQHTIYVPVKIFQNDILSPLECLVLFLLQKNHSVSQISIMLRRGQSTISTAKKRAEVKQNE